MLAALLADGPEVAVFACAVAPALLAEGPELDGAAVAAGAVAPKSDGGGAAPVDALLVDV